MRIGKLKNKGFSLVELLLVAAILAALVGISIPNFKKTYERLKLRNTADNISRFINFAQQRAILEENIFKVMFDYDAKSYWLMEASQPGQKDVLGGGTVEFTRAGGRLGKKMRIPQDLSMDGDKEEVIFYPDGNSGRARVELSNQKGAAIIITSTGIMGNVDIEEKKN
ncbi:MAG: prepilin-type N-terminal cleavage/methylation domain-containing protein [Candidatus Omnitrophota bacterium]